MENTTQARWYCVCTNGGATLCLDEADARQVAQDFDRNYPTHAPHTATQLFAVPADAVQRAAQAYEREAENDGFVDNPDAFTPDAHARHERWMRAALEAALPGYNA